MPVALLAEWLQVVPVPVHFEPELLQSPFGLWPGELLQEQELCQSKQLQGRSSSPCARSMVQWGFCSEKVAVQAADRAAHCVTVRRALSAPPRLLAALSKLLVHLLQVAQGLGLTGAVVGQHPTEICGCQGPQWRCSLFHHGFLHQLYS